MQTIKEILNKIRNLKGIKKDRKLAKLLCVAPSTITTWTKRGTIPYDVLFRFCEENEIDPVWLLTGKITTKYIEVEGKRVLVMSDEPGLYKGAGMPVYDPQAQYTTPSPSTRKLLENVREILETGPDDIVTALEANIKAFLSATRAAKEKRSYPRVLVTMPVEFQIMDQSENHAGAIMNGSQMGCLIQASNDMPVRTRLNLKVTLPGKPPEDSFRATAEIMWKDKPRSDDTETYHYGVRFLEVLNEGHAKLESLITGCHEAQDK